MNDTRLFDYIGNTRQLYGMRSYTLNSGLSDGVSAIDVDTGSGFCYTVVASRALDISLASFRGTNLTYLSPVGEVHPSYYNRDGAEWMHSFFGGLLTTCGPYNIGKASSGTEGVFGLHDRFSNTPAKNICIEDRETLRISVEIDFGALCCDKLRVFRVIESVPFSACVRITDRITNYGFREAPLLLLYHTNYGYPLLSEHTQVYFNALKTEYYDDYSRADAANVHCFEAPSAKNGEKNYFHRLPATDGYCHAAVVNPMLDHLGVLLRYRADTLPWLTHCKIANPVDYLLAIEPCNTPCMGRDTLRERGLIPTLAPGETQEFSVEFTVSSGEETKKRILPLFRE